MTNKVPIARGDCAPDYVETITVTLVSPPEVFELESGEWLPELRVAYETYGALNAAKDNAILICHGFTASAHAAGKHNADSYAPGWWDSLIGPGCAFDTDRYFIICSNCLGSCKGTTGPCSIDPRSGRPYGPKFPQVTIGDMVAAQRKLLDYLGIKRLYAVTGASMGGMQALEWGIRHPEQVRLAIPIGAATRWSAQAVALSAAGRMAIEADGAFHNGEYYGHRPPVRGMAVARMIGHTTYVSPEFLESHFRRGSDEPGSDVLGYFEDECERFVARFDANSYIALSLAMERFDIAHELDPAVRGRSPHLTDTRITPADGVSWMLVSFSSDWLFPPDQMQTLHLALQRAGDCSLHVTIQTEAGHDAFLNEPHKLAAPIADFLRQQDAQLE